MISILYSKAVDRGDKRTRRLRGRVLALRETIDDSEAESLLSKKRLADADASAQLSEKTIAEDEYLIAGPRLETGPWSKVRGRGCPLMGHEPRTMDLNGTELQMKKFTAEKITVLTTQNMNLPSSVHM